MAAMEIINISISFLVLTILEIILSIDNVLFISLATSNLPIKYQPIARRLGVLLAVFGRIILLFSINWLVTLQNPIATIFSFNLSIKDIIMMTGGLYLVFYSNQHIFKELASNKADTDQPTKKTSFFRVLLVIFVFDSIFSFDSVLTAVAIGHNLTIMVLSIIVAVIALIFSVNTVSNFIIKNPSVKILALSFLILVGFNLFIEGLHYNIPKIYLFVIMGFSTFVQIISLKINNKQKTK